MQKYYSWSNYFCTNCLCEMKPSYTTSQYVYMALAIILWIDVYIKLQILNPKYKVYYTKLAMYILCKITKPTTQNYKLYYMKTGYVHILHYTYNPFA